MTQADNRPFADANALIFGGGVNIGRAIAREFARRGARIAIGDIDHEGATEAARRIAEEGGTAIALRCDVTSDQSVAEAVDRAEQELGSLDIVANNAGILSGGNPEDIPLSEWQRMMDINLFGMIRSINIVLPRMIERGRGHIVNTASFAGFYPFATSRIHYAASKAAVVSMSENLALYCADKGVRVSCLCPGPVITTSIEGMRHFSETYEMRAPGSHLTVKTQEATAIILADGMRDGRIIIPTHEEVWATLQDRAASPDGFISGKADAFAAGDSGRPTVPAEMMRRS